MPTYEYRCRDCGRAFDIFQRMSDKPAAPCPDCGRAAERLISGGAGVLFKGDGFYITDHRSDDYRRKAREEAGVGAGKDSGGKGDRDSGGEAGKDVGGKERKDSGAKAGKGFAAAGGSQGGGTGSQDG